MARVIAIFGAPGVGKTTTAKAIVEAFGAQYVSSGDVARKVDPEALARGEMADRQKLAAGFKTALEQATIASEMVVVDGLPRDPGDVFLLPEDTEYLLLDCDKHISVDRQLRRSRPDDDMELIRKRTVEQRALLELDKPDGWAHRLCDWTRALNTGDKSRDRVIELAIRFIRGESRTLA